MYLLCYATMIGKMCQRLVVAGEVVEATFVCYDSGRPFEPRTVDAYEG